MYVQLCELSHAVLMCGVIMGILCPFSSCLPSSSVSRTSGLFWAAFFHHARTLNQLFYYSLSRLLLLLLPCVTVSAVLQTLFFCVSRFHAIDDEDSQTRCRSSSSTALSMVSMLPRHVLSPSLSLL